MHVLCGGVWDKKKKSLRSVMFGYILPLREKEALFIILFLDQRMFSTEVLIEMKFSKKKKIKLSSCTRKKKKKKKG